ncbi:hypothetical protein ABZ512_06160 [Nocardiopsis dassonvillei]|uniref:hypothetical protein n=1 Tax=Nocardiopsis dassonvillei TaxID=2014 RepID=UPI0033C2C00A
MDTPSPSPVRSRTGLLRRAVPTVLGWHRPLAATTALCLALLAVAVVGLLLDDRVVHGDPVWLKPAKFAVSIGVYNVTLAWLLSLLTRWRRTGWWLGTVAAVMLAGELVAIVIQTARGQASHFNYATPFDSAVYNAMAAMIVAVWVANLAIGALLLTRRLDDRSTTWAIRTGIAIGLVGMGLAYLMTSPTAEQMTAMREGGVAEVIGAHTVGYADGGPGLPLVGWSTVAGDLRVPHFVGLHGLQVMVLLALALTAWRGRYPRLASDALRLRVVAVVGASYTALVALTTWQALRGQSVVRPDALTLAVAGALAAGTLLGLWWALRRRSEERGERSAPVPERGSGRP